MDYENEYCEDCRAEDSDYYTDESGEMVCACDSCYFNIDRKEIE